MKKFLAVFLTIVCLATLCCGCGDNASTSEPQTNKVEISSEPENQSMVDDIKDCITDFLKAADENYVVEFTDEKVETKDGKTTTTFKWFNGIITTSVIESDSKTEQILSWALPSSFGTDNAIVLCATMCVLPLVCCDSDNDIDSLYQSIISTTPENTDGTLGYTCQKNNWTYFLTANSALITAGAKPIQENSDTSEPITSSNQTASTESENAQTPVTSTESKNNTSSANTDPCANGHLFSSATCTSPSVCSVCNATSGAALGHDINLTKCTRCDYSDFSKIARSYTNLSSYDLVSGEEYNVQNFKISSAGVMSFTFNGKDYALSLVQTNQYEGNTNLLIFDCYANGAKEPNATAFLDDSYYIPRLKWKNLDGCNLYIFAE